MSTPDPAAYVTEIDCQSTGNTVLHSLHTRMPDPEPLPGPEPEPEPDQIVFGPCDRMIEDPRADPDQPVPYTLTSQAEAALAAVPQPEAEADPWNGPQWDPAIPDPGDPGYEDALAAAREAEAEWAGEWDSAGSYAYQLRVEAGLEPEPEP